MEGKIEDGSKYLLYTSLDGNTSFVHYLSDTDICEACCMFFHMKC